MKEQFENQGNILQNLFKQEQQVSKKKLGEKNKQIQILRIQNKRKDKKIKELQIQVSQMNTLSKTSSDLLSHAGETAHELLLNENNKKNKLSHENRYSKQVKQFAVTLHYLSPKA